MPNAKSQNTKKSLGRDARQLSGGRTREAILNAAEKLFSESGFSGTSLRQIAEEAGVAQPLIHYHFKTKERLFEAIFARRSGAINGERLARLEALLDPNGETPPKLEDIIEALLRPTLELGHDTSRGGQYFSRLLVSIANSSDRRAAMLAAKYYDPMARRFIAALGQALPDLPKEDVVWGYLFAIGVGMTSMASTGRAAVLSDGLCDDRDVEAILERVVPFLAGGLRALEAQARRGGTPLTPLSFTARKMETDTKRRT